MPAGRSSIGPPIGHPAHGPPLGYAHPGHAPMPLYHPGYGPPPGQYDPRMGAPPPGHFPPGYGAPPPGYAQPLAAHPPAAHGPPPGHGPAGAGPPGGAGPSDFARERPEAYSAFEQMAIHPARDGGTEIRLPDGMCRDKHVADFMQCLQCWLWRHQGDPRAIGRPWRIRCLDLSRNGLSDASATLVLEQIQRIDLRVDRLRLSGNGLEAKGLAKVTEYIWNCSTALLEVDLSNNLVEADPTAGATPGSDAVSALLRCFYNHASYPQIVTAANGAAQVLPLVLNLGGNKIKDPAKLLKLIEAKGGKRHVKIRPSPEPYDHVDKEYLSVCMPDFLEQAVPETKERKRRKDRSHSGHREKADKKEKRPKISLKPAKEVAAKVAHTEKLKKEKKSKRKAHSPAKKEPDHWRAASPKASDSAREDSASPAPAPAAAASSGGGARSALVLTDEQQQNLQLEVGAKLASFGGLPSEESTRDMLSEFVVCMAVAGKGSEEIHKELEAFLADEAATFVTWFSAYIQKWKRK